jgi:hypothetical protein
MSLCSLSYLGGVLDRAYAILCGSDAVTCPVTGRIIKHTPPPPTLQYHPPIQQLTIPVQQPFAVAATGGFNHGNGGGGKGGHSRQGHGGHWGGRNQRTLFVNYGRTQGVRGIGQGHDGGRFIPQAPGAFTPQAPTFVQPNAQNIALPFSNIVKSYGN